MFSSHEAPGGSFNGTAEISSFCILHTTYKGMPYVRRGTPQRDDLLLREFRWLREGKTQVLKFSLKSLSPLCSSVSSVAFQRNLPTVPESLGGSGASA